MTAAYPWLKCVPNDFLNGIGDLSNAHEIALYTVILMRIYDSRGPIKDDLRALATRGKMGPQRCQRALDRLVELGKIQMENGCISNARSLAEFARFETKSEKIFQGLNQTAELEDEKPNENSVASAAPRTRAGARNQTQIEEKETPSGVYKDSPPSPPLHNPDLEIPEKFKKDPPPKTSTKPRKQTGNGKAKTALLDWKPDEQDYVYAESLGLDPDRILQDLRDWAVNAAPARARKLDPRAFWQGWCRREADRATSTGHSSSSRQRSADIDQAGLRVLTRRGQTGEF